MELLGTVASSTRQGLSTTSFESIATVTLTATSNSISFTSIPASYAHLQIRGNAKDNRATYLNSAPKITFNNTTSGSTAYFFHWVYGTGDGSLSYSGVNSTSFIQTRTASTGSASAYNLFFGTMILDVMDYTNTNKNKTVKIFEGCDANSSGTGAGLVAMTSGHWASTSAITDITIAAEHTPFQIGTTYALYGIKG